MRIAIVGLGVISRFYLAALHDSGPMRLAAVCDTRPEALAPYRDEVPCWRDHRAMVAAGGLDAAVVTAPNDAHHPVVWDLLDSGLPVCVEKPLATRLSDGMALTDLAAARGAVLFTSFHRRYNARVQALRSALPTGVPVESVRIRYLEKIEDHDGRHLNPTRGGCVADNGPNALDLARHFAGPLTLTTADIHRDDHGIDHWACLRLRSTSGTDVSIELDWNHPGERKDIEIHLADGSTHHADMLAGFPGFKQSLWHEYAGVLRDFGTALRVGAGPEGLAALTLVDAAYQAERTLTSRTST